MCTVSVTLEVKYSNTMFRNNSGWSDGSFARLKVICEITFNLSVVASRSIFGKIALRLISQHRGPQTLFTINDSYNFTNRPSLIFWLKGNKLKPSSMSKPHFLSNQVHPIPGPWKLITETGRSRFDILNHISRIRFSTQPPPRILKLKVPIDFSWTSKFSINTHLPKVSGGG